MSAMASQITNLTIVYSNGYSSADQRKHQSSASLAFVRGIHRWPVNSPHKGPVTRKMFPFDDVIMIKVPVKLYAVNLFLFLGNMEYICPFCYVSTLRSPIPMWSLSIKEKDSFIWYSQCHACLLICVAKTSVVMVCYKLSISGFSTFNYFQPVRKCVLRTGI